jgi:hypothetical protein
MKHGNLFKNVHGLKQKVSKTMTITENITVYVISEKQLEEKDIHCQNMQRNRATFFNKQTKRFISKS